MPSKKKDQHFIPRCYLNGFLSSDRPTGHENNKHFRPGVWVRRKDLSDEWKLKSTDNRKFKRSYYYNLPNDSLENPLVENILGYFETQYTPIRQKLHHRQPINLTDLRNLSIFCYLLFTRTEKRQDSLTETFRKLGEFTLAYEGVGPNDSTFQDMQSHMANIPKWLLSQIDLAKTVLERNPQFVINHTDIPYITSDNPVVHWISHVDEVIDLVGRDDVVGSGYLRNVQEATFLLPIAPEIMMIASPFLDDHDEFPFVDCRSETAIIQANLRIVSNAHEMLISQRSRPFVRNEGELKKLIDHISDPSQIGDWILVYSATNRYKLAVRDCEHEGNRIKFLPTDLSVLADIVNDGNLERVEIFHQGKAFGGMREIVLGDVDPSGETYSYINWKLNLPINR